MTEAEARRSGNSFDLLRLVAAILVVIGHIEWPYFGAGDWYAYLTGFQSSGGLGVSIFFVISGYLVMQSRWRTGATEFFRRRFLRIFPGLAAWILVLVVAGYFFSGVSLTGYLATKRMFAFLLNVLVLPLNPCVASMGEGYAYGCNLTGAIWSLTYELVMYAVVGLLGFFSTKNQAAAMIAMLIAILILIMRDMLFPLGEITWAPGGITLFLFIPYRGLPFMALFLVGALLNFFTENALKSPITLLLAGVLYVGSFQSSSPMFFTVQTLAFPFIVLWFGLRRFRLTELIEKIGDLSYGVFLYHWPIMTFVWIAFHDRTGPVVMTVIVFMATALAAYVSYHAVEGPALRRRVRQRPQPRPARAAARPPDYPA